jgi:hypothetical protein
VGINIGDVIVEPHDIFGDGVNIAQSGRDRHLNARGWSTRNGKRQRGHATDREPAALIQ